MKKNSIFHRRRSVRADYDEAATAGLIFSNPLRRRPLLPERVIRQRQSVAAIPGVHSLRVTCNIFKRGVRDRGAN